MFALDREPLPFRRFASIRFRMRRRRHEQRRCWNEGFQNDDFSALSPRTVVTRRQALPVGGLEDEIPGQVDELRSPSAALRTTGAV